MLSREDDKKYSVLQTRKSAEEKFRIELPVTCINFHSKMIRPSYLTHNTLQFMMSGYQTRKYITTIAVKVFVEKAQCSHVPLVRSRGARLGSIILVIL